MAQWMFELHMQTLDSSVQKHDFTFQALSRKKFVFEQLIRNIFQSYYGRWQTLTQFYYNNSKITKKKYHFSFLWFILFLKPLNCYWAQKAFSKYIICALRKVTKDTSPSIISTLMMTHVFRPAGLHKGERLLGQLYWTSDPTNARVQTWMAVCVFTSL